MSLIQEVFCVLPIVLRNIHIGFYTTIVLISGIKGVFNAYFSS